VIVQSGSTSSLSLILTMEQHTATAARLAEHFGDTPLFDRIEPNELVVPLVKEHDHGWVDIDASAPRDPSTDLPWSVYDAPLAHSLEAGVKSIDHNERCHPYRGLISSMHICGLHNGRFGMNEAPSLDHLTQGMRQGLEDFLTSEHDRRQRLISELGADQSLSPWIGDNALMRVYKALQFFDRLALWLQVAAPSARRPTKLQHIPGSNGAEHTISVSQLDDHRVRLNPYPFDSEPLEIEIHGRAMKPQLAGTDLAQILNRAEPMSQTVIFVA